MTDSSLRDRRTLRNSGAVRTSCQEAPTSRGARANAPIHEMLHTLGLRENPPELRRDHPSRGRAAGPLTVFPCTG